MITIKRDESLHLEIGKIYPRSLLHEAFRKIRGVVRKKEISDFPIIENDALLMVLHYEKNYIRTDFGRRLVSQLLEIEACNPRIEDLDFTFLQRFDGFIFAEFDEYTFLIAELVHRYIPSARLFFVGEDDLWKCFFTTEEVSVLYDLKDYQVTGCKHVCFIDSNENLQPKYQPGTKCLRYNSVNVVMSVFWASKVEYMGEENPQEKILLLDYRTGKAGLMDIIKFTYDYVHIAEERGWTPVIKLDAMPNQYLLRDGDNMWEYFFRPVSRISVEKAIHSAHVIRASSNYMMLNQWDENLYQNETQLQLDKALRQSNIGDFRGIIRLNFETEREIFHRMPVEFRCDDNILGVMCRGTDYSEKARKKRGVKVWNATPEMMLEATRYYVKKYRIRYVFLATEEENVYLKFQQAFPEKLIAIEQKRVRYDAEKNPDASVADLLALKDGREFGRTYLAVLYALGKCRYLIASMYCGATMGAFAFTERGFDRYELINDQSLLRLQMEEAEQDAGHPIIFMQMHQSVKGWTKWKSEMEDVSSGAFVRSKHSDSAFPAVMPLSGMRRSILKMGGATAA